MKNKKRSLAYLAVKTHFRFWVNGIFYRHYYALDTENIPADGTPTLIAMNHQNALNDALGILFAINDRKPHFIARADAFDIAPWFKKFLLWIGLLPAFRMQYKGGTALDKNAATFEASEQSLLDGDTVTIFPEAGHQTIHWLGYFSLGYLRMAFQAAEKSGFEKEIFILPAINHYSKYNGLKNDMLVRFGKPISIKPWYELHQTRPRTAEREVNEQVRAQLRSMMLDVQDLDNYDDIDFIRTNQWGRDYALKLGKNPDYLPERLEADRALVQQLADNQTDYSAVKAYREALETRRFEDRQVLRKPSVAGIILRSLLLILLAPLGLLATWPSHLCWYLPIRFNKLDILMQATFQLAMSTILIIPISFVLTWVVTGLLTCWWVGLIHALLIPALCEFEWHYCKLLQRTWRDIRFRCADTRFLQSLREKIDPSIKL